MFMDDQLWESRGFAARKPGDSFVDPTNAQDLATFAGIETLPADDIAYDSMDQFVKAYTAWKRKAERTSTVYELNKLRSVIRAAMIISMDTPRGNEKFVLFTLDNSKMEGKLTSVPPHVVNPQHGGYVLNRATSLSERAGVKPSDVLTTGKKLYKPSEVPALLDAARAQAGDQVVDQMQAYLTALVNKKGTNFVIKDGAQYASLHQKYLGEWAAPIALITSQFDPKNQLPAIQDSMLDGEPVRLGKVEYNTNPTDTLSDSAVVVKGSKIHISSKAHKGGGAAASLKGIHETIVKNLSKFDPNFWRTKRHKRFREVVDTIIDNSAPEGVLTLAVEEQIIPATEPAKIQKLIADKSAKVSLHKTVRALMAGYAANELHPQYNAGKHALAAIAKALCDQLNEEDYTNVAKTILSMSNIVQMMFVTGISGKDLIAKGFDMIWPPKFEGKIFFYSGKNFSATEIKGKLGFKISKTKVVDEPDESLAAPSLTKAAIQAQKKAAELKVGKITQAGARDKRDVSVPDVVALGRAKKTR